MRLPSRRENDLFDSLIELYDSRLLDGSHWFLFVFWQSWNFKQNNVQLEKIDNDFIEILVKNLLLIKNRLPLAHLIESDNVLSEQNVKISNIEAWEERDIEHTNFVSEIINWQIIRTFFGHHQHHQFLYEFVRRPYHA